MKSLRRCSIELTPKDIWILNEVKENEILIQDLSGNRETVQIPEGIYKLIEVNRQYWIKYEHREWEEPELISIEPQ